MKKVTIFSLALIVILYPLQVFAVWWNPFTWKIFAPKIQPTQHETKVPDIEKTVPLSTSTQQRPKNVGSTTPAAQPITIKEPAPLNPTNTAIPQRERDEITLVVKNFLNALKNRDGVFISTQLSSNSKSWINNVFQLAKTGTKEQILSQKYSTILGITTIRTRAASTTIDLRVEDVIAETAHAAPNKYLDHISTHNLNLDFTYISQNKIEVGIILDGEVAFTYTVIKENNIWKIDTSDTLAKLDENFERTIQEQVRKSGKSRGSVVDSIFTLLFGTGETQLSYLIWVPLNQRVDLKADNLNNIQLNLFSNTVAGYSIQVPLNWTLESAERSDFFIAPYSTDELRPNVVVTYGNNNGITLDNYARNMKESLPTSHKNVTGDVTLEKTTFQDMPAYRIKYNRLRTFDEGRTYITQVIDSYVFFANNQIFLIEYRNGLADYENGKELSQQIINTFRIEKPCVVDPCSTYAR